MKSEVQILSPRPFLLIIRRPAPSAGGVTAGGPSVPPPLVQQLAEGGRMVLPVGSPENQALTIVENVGGDIRTRAHSECKFVKLVGKYAWEP